MCSLILERSRDWGLESGISVNRGAASYTAFNVAALTGIVVDKKKSKSTSTECSLYSALTTDILCMICSLDEGWLSRLRSLVSPGCNVREVRGMIYSHRGPTRR